jgi:hypothetical protein
MYALSVRWKAVSAAFLLYYFSSELDIFSLLQAVDEPDTVQAQQPPRDPRVAAAHGHRRQESALRRGFRGGRTKYSGRLLVDR